MVKIGICGHRNIKNLRNLTNRIDEVLNKIIAHFGQRSIHVISSLAEGADRLVVERALKLFSANLIVPLPLEKSEYLLDFITDKSKEQFDEFLDIASLVVEIPPAKTREAAYLVAGKYILDQCDILIALWDGEAARGVAGTGNIVRLARKIKKPIVWIFTQRADEELNLQTKDIVYENFASQFYDRAGE